MTTVIRQDCSEVGNPEHRLIRYTILGESGILCIERVRSNSDDSRRDDDPMEKQRVVIRFPASLLNPKCGKESETGGSEDDTSNTRDMESELDKRSGRDSEGLDENRESSDERGERESREGILQSMAVRWFDVEKLEIIQMNMNHMSEEGKDLLEEATSVEDRKRKKRVWEKFKEYMRERQIGIVSPELIVSYIARRVYRDKASYAVVAGEKSALMMILKVIARVDWSVNPIVRLAMQAVNRIRPVKPRYSKMWDIRALYNYYANKNQKAK
jgi:hypothetical protein